MKDDVKQSDIKQEARELRKKMYVLKKLWQKGPRPGTALLPYICYHAVFEDVQAIAGQSFT